MIETGILKALFLADEGVVGGAEVEAEVKPAEFCCQIPTKREQWPSVFQPRWKQLRMKRKNSSIGSRWSYPRSRSSHAGEEICRSHRRDRKYRDTREWAIASGNYVQLSHAAPFYLYFTSRTQCEDTTTSRSPRFFLIVKNDASIHGRR